MASSTDTLPGTSDTATGGVTHPSPQRPPTRARRTALAWAAVVAACLAVAALAVVTLRGGSETDNTPPTRLDPRAEQYERQAHLDGQANTYGRDRGSSGSDQHLANLADEIQRERSVESGSDRHLANLANGIQSRRSLDAESARRQAQADANLAEQQAHLDGQAKTYGKADESGSTSDRPSNDGFVPGSRRMPLR